MSSKPTFTDFVQEKLNGPAENLSHEKLVRFWNDRNFTPSTEGAAFLSYVKKNYLANVSQQVWKAKAQLLQVDIARLQLAHKGVRIHIDKIDALNKGYKFALIGIAQQELAIDLNAKVTAAQAKGEEEFEKAQVALRNLSAEIKKITEYVLGEDIDEPEYGTILLFEEEESNIVEATLRAIAKGDKGSIQSVIDKFYTNQDVSDEDTDALLPKDHWEKRKVTLETFRGHRSVGLENMHLFKDDHLGIKSGVFGLFEYIDKLPSTRQAFQLSPKLQLNFIARASGAHKQTGLHNFVQNFVRAQSLEEMEQLIRDQLNDRENDQGLLKNRGPIGGYWVGSFFKGLRNPEDGRYVNSTTESKLVGLLNEVLAQKEQVESLKEDRESSIELV